MPWRSPNSHTDKLHNNRNNLFSERRSDALLAMPFFDRPNNLQISHFVA